MPILVMKYIFSNLQKQAPWIIKPIVNGICNKINELYLGPNIRVHLDFLEAELGKRKWLAGDQFSGADIQVVLLRLTLIRIALLVIDRQVLPWRCSSSVPVSMNRRYRIFLATFKRCASDPHTNAQWKRSAKHRFQSE